MRIDVGIPIGLALGLAGIIGSVLIEGGSVLAFANLSAFLIIGGGTLGAAMVSTTIRDVMRLPALVHKALWGWVGADSQQLIQTVVRAAQRARKDGILALETMAEDPALEPFLARGLRLIVDGADEAAVGHIMRAEIAAMQRRHQRGIALLESMGGYAPTMGIIGTVLGLVHVLSKLGDGGTEGLGEGIAIAFIATLYGIFSANVLFLPLAGNLQGKSAEEAFRREMVLEGILGIQAGHNPHLLELRLNAYYPIPPDDRSRIGLRLGTSVQPMKAGRR
jgi:chemotaxis protein MotA